VRVGASACAAGWSLCDGRGETERTHCLAPRVRHVAECVWSACTRPRGLIDDSVRSQVILRHPEGPGAFVERLRAPINNPPGMARSLRPRMAKRVWEDSASTDDENDEEVAGFHPVLTTKRRPKKQLRSAPVETGEEEDAADGLSDAAGDEGNARRPVVCGRNWLPMEDARLLSAVEKYGSSWKQIAEALKPLGTRRTTAMCRNRYQRIVAPTQPGKEGRNRCKKCGQVKRGHTCTAPNFEGGLLPVEEEDASLATQPQTAPMRAPRVRYEVDRLSFRTPNPRASHGTEGDLSAHSILIQAVGNDFKVDERFLAKVNQGEASLTASEEADAGAALGGVSTASHRLPGFLGSLGPPLIAANKRPSASGQRSSGSITASFLSELVHLSEVPMAELHMSVSDLQNAAEAALNSRSFASFVEKTEHGKMKSASDEATDLAAMEAEGEAALADDRWPSATSRPEVETPTVTSTDEAFAFSPLAFEEKAVSSAELSVERCASRLAVRGSGPEHAYDQLLPLPATEASYDVPINEELPPVAPPRLVALPSFSRAPSFSFADKDKSAALLPPPAPRFSCVA